MLSTDNYRKHTTQNPAQRFLINNFFKTFLHEASLLKPSSVLDAGCGEGFTLEKLKTQKIGKSLYGIDFSEAAIKIGKDLHPHINLEQGSIYEIPYKPNTFDLTICTEVLEHLEYPRDALKELARVTKKYSIISVPNEPFFMLANFLRGKNLTHFGNDIEHIQHWSRGGITKLVNKYFNVIKIKNPFPWTLVIAQKKS